MTNSTEEEVAMGEYATNRKTTSEMNDTLNTSYKSSFSFWFDETQNAKQNCSCKVNYQLSVRVSKP